MNTQQKALAMNALGDVELGLTFKGDWHAVVRGVEVKEGPVLGCGTGFGETPELALEALWTNLTGLTHKQCLIRDAMDKGKRRAFRWNGFMWAEIDEETLR